MEGMNKINPPNTLMKNILLGIGREERRRARLFLFVSVTAVPLSVLGIVFSIQYMLQGFYQSSFHSYFSLLLSDPDIVLTYWREFALSLADSIPFAGMTISLITIAVLLVSIRIFANNLRNGLSRSFGNA